MSESIVLIVDDLMFLPKLQTGVQQLGYRPLPATNESELTRALFQSPVLVIVDLFSRAFDWVALIGLVKKSKVGPVPVLGFGPHVDLSLREKALAAGCDAVVGRGAIAGQLPHLINKHKRRFDRDLCGQPAPDKVRRGIELFNRGAYFECHEIIELAWNEEPGPARLLYQAILQIGVACHHAQNKNWPGAMKVLDRGVAKLRHFAPACMGINVNKLLADAAAIRQELLRLGPDWPGEFDPGLWPTIETDFFETAAGAE
ncbi:MAG: hypothetical protein FOGNACKC_03614 [Anaerolineae bacterium]|nr:hypothetical protein [Anaerolineae bacterium]